MLHQWPLDLSQRRPEWYNLGTGCPAFDRSKPKGDSHTRSAPIFNQSPQDKWAVATWFLCDFRETVWNALQLKRMWKFRWNTEQSKTKMLYIFINSVAVGGPFFFIDLTATLLFASDRMYLHNTGTLRGSWLHQNNVCYFLFFADWTRLLMWKHNSTLLHYLVNNSLSFFLSVSLSASKEPSRWSQGRMEGLTCLLSDCQAHESALLQHGTFLPSGSCFLPFPVDALFPSRPVRYTRVLFCFCHMLWRDSSPAR